MGGAGKHHSEQNKPDRKTSAAFLLEGRNKQVWAKLKQKDERTACGEKTEGLWRLLRASEGDRGVKEGWGARSAHICGVQSFCSVVQICSLLANFLSEYYSHCWKLNIEVCYYYYISCYFFLQLYQRLFWLFRCTDTGCIYTYIYILLMNWPFYHYMMTFFVACDIFFTLYLYCLI